MAILERSDLFINIMEVVFVHLLMFAFVLSEMSDPEAVQAEHPIIEVQFYGESILLHLNEAVK